MKKFTKWSGVLLLIFAIASLLRKSSIKKSKTEIIHLRQLVNRLIEQTRNCKSSLTQLTTAFHKMNLAQLQNHLNDFNHQITPQIHKIQVKSKQLKKDFKH